MIFTYYKKDNPDIQVVFDAENKKEAEKKLKELLGVTRLARGMWVLEGGTSNEI